MFHIFIRNTVHNSIFYICSCCVWKVYYITMPRMAEDSWHTADHEDTSLICFRGIKDHVFHYFFEIFISTFPISTVTYTHAMVNGEVTDCKC